jgi:hypothetical protein
LQPADLWDSLSAVYRQYALYYTTFYAAYEKVFPPKRHQSVGRDTGKTSDIERFNNTLMLGISRSCNKNSIILLEKALQSCGTYLVFYPSLQ